MNETEPWLQALIIIRRVQETIGDDLSHKFRSTQTCQAYTGLCGEVYHAHQEGELDQELVDMLAEQAQKVTALHEDWED